MLSIQGLSRAYGAVQAVSDVSFVVAAGEIVGLLGRNGVGKTTTLECILGLRRPDAGRVTVCGIDARADPMAAKRRIGAALQSTGLQDRISPREALDFFSHLSSAPASEVASLLSRFGLTDKADTAYETLSGGQKQRLALALAFVGDPRLIVLDEPTAGLDVQMRRELHDHIRILRQDGRAVLLATHDMEEAGSLCDRILVMDAGRIVAQGKPADLLAASRAASLEDLVLSLMKASTGV